MKCKHCAKPAEMFFLTVSRSLANKLNKPRGYKHITGYCTSYGTYVVQAKGLRPCDAIIQKQQVDKFINEGAEYNVVGIDVRDL